MKKSCLLLLLCTALLISCEDQSDIVPTSDELSVVQDVDMTDFYLYTDQSDDTGKIANGKGVIEKCYSMKMLNKQLDANPGLYQKMYNVEKHTRQFIAGKKPDRPGGGNGNGNGGGGNGGGGSDPTPFDETVNIPVYVYVVYANNSQNISDSQINSQITVLNNDFNDTNYNDVPSEFRGVAADIDIQFTLDPSNIDRRSNSTASWGTNNAVKSEYPAVPGYLTIWVANIGNNILGYAQFPGGPASTDGVVISPQYFGTNGTAAAPFDQGRTATHEVGHWLNLRHIWGDGRCKQDDFVSDTPSSDRPNYGCPGSVSHCRSRDMTMNYMDYTDDDCMYMFTIGQVDRMRALFASGGIREDLIN